MEYKYFALLAFAVGNAQAAIVEWDRAAFFHPQVLHVKSGEKPVLRIHSRGDTKIEVQWKGEGGLRIEGPSLVRESQKSPFPAVLPKEGIYRLIPLQDSGTIEITTTCVENCFRPELTPQEAWKQLKREEMLPIVKKAHQKVREISEDRETQKRLASALVANFKNLNGTRFPILPPFHEAGKFQGLLGGWEAEKPHMGKILKGDVDTILAEGMKVPLAEPEPLAKDLPHLRYGHFNDVAIPEIVLRQSPVVAQILTSLALGNGSQLEWKIGNKTLTLRNPGDFLEVLQDTGHHIVWESERTNANFIALVIDDKYVRWPAWVDTGIPLADGRNLEVPMGHSQQSWQIHGPLINARVAFFLGINGVGFFANTDERPAWTGLAAKHLVENDNLNDLTNIFSSLALATRYIRQVQLDLAGPAKGAPANGYGFLGVCNDSNAFIEWSLFGTKTTYPWVRSPALNESKGPLDKLFAQIPGDVQLRADDLKVGGKSRRETLCRILGMTPYPMSSTYFPDIQLAKDLAEIATEVGDGC